MQPGAVAQQPVTHERVREGQASRDPHEERGQRVDREQGAGEEPRHDRDRGTGDVLLQLPENIELSGINRDGDAPIAAVGFSVAGGS